MLTAWSEAIGVGPRHRLTLAKVLEIAAQMTPVGYSKEAAKHPDLQAAVHVVATRGQSQHTDIKVLGRWMQKRKGRVIDGLCFMVMSNPKGGSKWWVEESTRRINLKIPTKISSSKKKQADNEKRKKGVQRV